jgi:TonB family protein
VVVARAIGLSLAVHLLVLAAVAVVWPALRRAQAGAAPAWLVTPLVESLLQPSEPKQSERALPPPTEVELRAPGDAIVDVAQPGAPSPAPNPDVRAGAAAASSAGGLGAPTLVTARADAATLRVQPYDAPRDYQLQRIRTGDRRESREQVRATPHPQRTPWLSSAPKGAGHAAASEKRTAVASTVTTSRDDADRAPPQIARDQQAGFSRPEVARDPAATEAASPSEEVADRVEQALVSDEKQPAPLELSRPASPGAGLRGQGEAASALGYLPNAKGPAPVPAGAPNLPDARTLALATFQRAYDLYLSRVKQKVDPLWEFPRELALALEQGDVLVGFTIRKDGTVRDIRVLKASGFPKFDKNVLMAIKKAAPFEPLPATLGSELHVTAPFEGSNPAIR